MTNELARLSGENRHLRGQLNNAESFDGLTFEDIVRLLEEHRISRGEFKDLPNTIRVHLAPLDSESDFSLLQLFELGFDEMATGFLVARSDRSILVTFLGFGLLRKEVQGNYDRYSITESGRRLRNRLLSRQSRAGLGQAN